MKISKRKEPMFIFNQYSKLYKIGIFPCLNTTNNRLIMMAMIKTKLIITL